MKAKKKLSSADGGGECAAANECSEVPLIPGSERKGGRPKEKAEV